MLRKLAFIAAVAAALPLPAVRWRAATAVLEATGRWSWRRSRRPLGWWPQSRSVLARAVAGGAVTALVPAGGRPPLGGSGFATK
jgi:hypothetical protein